MGRRWGKSVLGGGCGITVAAKRGKVAWVVPEYKNARPIWRTLRQLLGDALQSGHVRIDEQAHAVEFSGGGFLGIYSADNNADSIRGDWFNLVVIDEAAMISQVAYEDAIRPTVADSGGDILLISTPKGRNWFWREFESGRASMSREIASFTAPTSDNPMPTIQTEFLRAKHTLPERSFRQEWMAEFVEDGGGVFRNVRAVSTLPHGEYNPRHFYCAGIDWGRTHDFTVFSVWDTTAKEQVHLERVTGLDFVSQGSRLIALCERWIPDQILAESNSIGRPMIEYLQRENIPIRGFEMTHASKLKLIDAYALGFERQAFQLLNNEQQIREHEAFEQQTLPGGTIRFTAPEGEFDDTVIAGALAWKLAQLAGDEDKPESLPYVADKLVDELPGMVKFFHTKPKRRKW